jgi:protein phosphatase
MTASIKVGNAQYIGARGEQEDYFGITDETDEDFVRHGGVVAVVADGVGGHAHGGKASELAVREFLRVYRAKPRGVPIPDALYKALKAANHAVCTFAEAEGETGNCGTTLAAAALHPESRSLYWANVGDSRIYLMRGQEWAQLTTDGNYASQQLKKVARGIAPQEALNPDANHRILTSFLGLKHYCEIERSLRPFTVHSGDWIVLCTDGVFNTLTGDELLGCLKSEPKAVCEMLVRAVLAKGLINQDNCTVAVMAYGLEDCAADVNAPIQESRAGGLVGLVKTRLGLKGFS